MFLHAQEIAECIAESTVHAREVCNRDHIRGNSMDRVEQFVVSLRRNLIYQSKAHFFPKGIVPALCDTRLWRDAGELFKDPPKCDMISREEFKDIIKRATEIASTNVSSLSLILKSIQEDNSKLDTLNNQSEELISQFVRLV